MCYVITVEHDGDQGVYWAVRGPDGQVVDSCQTKGEAQMYCAALNETA